MGVGKKVRAETEAAGNYMDGGDGSGVGLKRGVLWGDEQTQNQTSEPGME